MVVMLETLEYILKNLCQVTHVKREMPVLITLCEEIDFIFSNCFRPIFRQSATKKCHRIELTYIFSAHKNSEKNSQNNLVLWLLTRI